MPQVPTATGIKIRSAADAHLLFFAVVSSLLPKPLIHSTSSPARPLSRNAPLLPVHSRTTCLTYSLVYVSLPIHTTHSLRRIIFISYHPAALSNYPITLHYVSSIAYDGFGTTAADYPSHLTWQLDDYGSRPIPRTDLRVDYRRGRVIFSIIVFRSVSISVFMRTNSTLITRTLFRPSIISDRLLHHPSLLVPLPP
jgi:hypothetical protein